MQTFPERVAERRAILDGAWPHFPVLPVKRDSTTRDAWIDVGLIAWEHVPSGGDRAVRVWLVSIFSLEAGLTYAEALKDVPFVDYPTIDTFLDDGWRGD